MECINVRPQIRLNLDDESFVKVWNQWKNVEEHSLRLDYSTCFWTLTTIRCKLDNKSFVKARIFSSASLFTCFWTPALCFSKNHLSKRRISRSEWTFPLTWLFSCFFHAYVSVRDRKYIENWIINQLSIFYLPLCTYSYF